MKAEKEKVLNQLSKPHRIAAKVLNERWPEVRETFPDTEGDFCGLNGEPCKFLTCEKSGRGSEGESDYT